MAKRPGRGPSGMMSAKSINNHMNILRMLMTEASDRYDFTNPYRNIKPLKLQRVHIEPFSLNEVETILRTVREDYRNYYLTRFYTGMRTGEVDGLKWEYVDFERREILVRETLIAGETEYTKTDGSQREIPMFGPANQVTPELQTELLATIMMTLEEMIPAAGTLLSGPAAPALAPDKEAFVHEQINEVAGSDGKKKRLIKDLQIVSLDTLSQEGGLEL